MMMGQTRHYLVLKCAALLGGAVILSLRALQNSPGRFDISVLRKHAYCLRNTLRMPHRLQWSRSLRCAVQVPIAREQIHAIQEGLSVREAATECGGQLLRD